MNSENETSSLQFQSILWLLKKKEQDIRRDFLGDLGAVADKCIQMVEGGADFDKVKYSKACHNTWLWFKTCQILIRDALAYLEFDVKQTEKTFGTYAYRFQTHVLPDVQESGPRVEVVARFKHTYFDFRKVYLIELLTIHEDTVGLLEIYSQVAEDKHEVEVEIKAYLDIIKCIRKKIQKAENTCQEAARIAGMFSSSTKRDDMP